MSAPLPPLTLPTIQNWSCHNCGGCCTQHLIEITDAERQRIAQQQWTANDGVTQPPVVWFAGPPWKKRYRLAHRPDGGCVFLDERGLCRIHAKFGEPAKPLACRVYPYALHPQGKSVTVSLRFSCPSVIANKGKPVPQQKGDLRALEELIVPPQATHSPAPRITARERLAWPEFLAVVGQLVAIMTEARVPLPLRALRGLAWVDHVGKAQLGGLERSQLHEFLGLLTAAVRQQFQKLPDMDEPGKVGRLYFRLFAAQYARKDTVRDLAGGLLGRWKLFRAILRYAKGQGEIPLPQAGWKSVPFDSLEPSFGPLPAGTDGLFARYWKVKLEGLHFCGPAYYGIPLVEGFQSLMLVLPVTLWLARWRAKSEGRDELVLADLEHALALVDHHHGYSEALGRRDARRRIRYLADSGELSRLTAWYAR